MEDEKRRSAVKTQTRIDGIGEGGVDSHVDVDVDDGVGVEGDWGA